MHLLSFLTNSRQTVALSELFAVLARLAKAVSAFDVKRIGVLFVALGQLFGASFADRPITPYKDPL